MNTEEADRLIRTLSIGCSRRGLLAGLVGSLLAIAPLALANDAAARRNKGKKKRNRKKQTSPPADTSSPLPPLPPPPPPPSPGCSEGETVCSGQCVNLRLDVANCGQCGNQCPGDGLPPGVIPICGGTACGQKCAEPGTTFCSDADGCVDRDTNRNHCGTCGNVCNVFQICQAGACENCGPGQVACGNICCLAVLCTAGQCGSLS
jgi:hypothetical protein